LTQIVTGLDYGYKELNDKEYILIGLNNCVKNGYKLKPVKGYQLVGNPGFPSIEDIVEYVRSEKYSITEFYVLLNQTITNGLNLTNGRKMERQEIYRRIDGERNYQDANWGSRRQMDGTPDEEKPVAEWINYIEFHLAKAKQEVYYLNTNGAAHELRKVAALAVRALEIHGCPERIVVKGTEEPMEEKN